MALLPCKKFNGRFVIGLISSYIIHVLVAYFLFFKAQGAYTCSYAFVSLLENDQELKLNLGTQG